MIRKLSLFLVVGAVALAACSDHTIIEFEADGPIAEAFQVPSSVAPLQDLDGTFADIAGDIPGFGGVYFDERGAPNVYMAAVEGAPALSVEALASQLNNRLRAHGLEGNISAQDLVIRPGDYDFRQLRGFHRGVMPVLAAPGVVFTDADETTNRIVVGIEPGTSDLALRNTIRRLGVPLAAVSIVETDPIIALQDATVRIPEAPLASNIGDLPILRDEIRPLVGGTQIWRFIPPGTASLCTLGFNAAAPSMSNERALFTNSHCTEVRGLVTGTEFNQKQLAFPLETVAVEIFDPPFFTNADNPDCPVGRRCRYSDAAVAEYVVPNQDVAFGRIAAPYPGTLVLPDANRTFRVAAEATSRAVIGQGLIKVGRTSGMTGAAVIATCQNANTAPDITMLCQERVAIDAIGGDSGSPVFEAMDNRPFMDVTPNQRVRLHGLLWGGSANTYVYSSMINIRMDIGGPWVVH